MLVKLPPSFSESYEHMHDFIALVRNQRESLVSGFGVESVRVVEKALGSKPSVL